MSEILMIIYETFKAGDIFLGLFQIAISMICIVGWITLWFYIIVIATCPVWISIWAIINYKIWRHVK